MIIIFESKYVDIRILIEIAFLIGFDDLNFYKLPSFKNDVDFLGDSIHPWIEDRGKMVCFYGGSALLKAVKDTFKLNNE